MALVPQPGPPTVVPFLTLTTSPPALLTQFVTSAVVPASRDAASANVYAPRFCPESHNSRRCEPDPSPTPAPPPSPTPPEIPVSPTPTPAPSLTGTRPTNVRSGPGTAYPVIGRLSQGETFAITGRSADSNWLQFHRGQRGWVSAELVNVTGEQSGLPVVQVRPPPTAAAPAGMALVPAGEFQMGCDTAHVSAVGCWADALPLHHVYLDSYFIDKTEVTNAMYGKCVQAERCTLPYESPMENRGSNFGESQYDDYPIVNVTWEQANAYCRWMRSGCRLRRNGRRRRVG